MADGGILQNRCDRHLGHAQRRLARTGNKHHRRERSCGHDWTLGAGGGAQTATASVAGATGSPLTFNATSPTVPTITVGPGNAAQFSPATITISAGQTVRFVWASGATNHNVSPDTGNPSPLPASPGLPGVQDAPFEYSATFPTAGTFKFFCTVHGGNPSNGNVNGMSGTVTVN